MARSNAPGEPGTVPSFRTWALDANPDGDASGFAAYDLEDAVRLLRRGENLLAVQGLNVGDSSSDLLLWPMLAARRQGRIGTGPGEGVRIYDGPLALERSVRIRARAERGGVWSPLEDVEFLVGASEHPTGSLALTVIHYHPLDPSGAEAEAGFEDGSLFEYLELSNIGPEPVSLDGVSVLDGVEYEFGEWSAVRALEPGDSLILAANPEAWRLRFGEHPRLAGPFSGGRLGNGGDRLILAGAQGEELFRVEYRDSSPWPGSADGEGDALALADPWSLPDPGWAGSWIAVAADPGSFLSLYRRWIFSEMGGEGDGTMPHEDPDGDLRPNIAEFLHGTDPLEADAREGGLRLEPDGAGWRLAFPVSPRAPARMWSLEASADLVRWESAVAGSVRQEDEGGRRWIRIGLDLGDDRRFFRLALRPVP